MIALVRRIPIQGELSSDKGVGVDSIIFDQLPHCIPQHGPATVIRQIFCATITSLIAHLFDQQDCEQQ